jgi:hypothetical protein
VTNSKFISKYFACPHKDRHYGNLLTEDGVLFSYGRHFPLAVPIPGGYLLNGDRYSHTTSQHQGDTRDAARDRGKVCIIPFSALREAMGSGVVDGVKHNPFEILDMTEDDYREVEYKDPETGETKTRTEHLLGSTLFQWGGDLYLSSTDPSGKWGRNYFLTKLKLGAIPPRTVGDAYFLMKPTEVIDAEAEGIEVKRQGEYFFIAATYGQLFGAKPPRFSKAQVLKGEPLPPADTRSHPHQHVPTETVKLGAVTLCRGTVRHRGEPYRVYWDDKLRYTEGDHKMLKLGKVWHIAVPNVQAESWGVNGRVD